MVKIQEFKIGSFFIDGKHFLGNVKISGNTIRYWDKPEDNFLYLYEISSMLKENPEVLVVGTGAAGLLKISDEVKNSILSKKI